ncbi:MAG TPA: alpha/beta fold hydrolase [Gemmatimonadaceae bacterium]|nr:alpha/beta fold hydrolase [Gemmatimonadaceae bacterium]
MTSSAAVALFSCFFLACSRSVESPRPGNSPPPGIAGLDQRVGWYQMPAGDTALLTYSATGGLRLFSLTDTLYWKTLTPGPVGLHWSDSTAAPTRWQVTEGRVTAFSWTTAGRQERIAHRLPGYGYRVEEVAVSRDGVSLSGSLFLPSGDGRAVPAALMIHGSGASDRDNAWYMMIADALVRNGIAVLLPDKRGSGKSEGDWFSANLTDFADDAVTQLELLRRHDAIDTARVGVIGLSQGGHVAPMVAGRADVAFVVNVVGSAVPLSEQLLHELSQDAKRDRLPGIFDPLVRRVSAWVVQRRRPEWWRINGPIDPLDHWKSVEVPSLVVYGADDEFDNVPVKRSVERLETLGSRHIRIRVFEGSGHALYEPGGRRVRQDFLDLLANWILMTPAIGDTSRRNFGNENSVSIRRLPPHRSRRDSEHGPFRSQVVASPLIRSDVARDRCEIFFSQRQRRRDDLPVVSTRRNVATLLSVATCPQAVLLLG